MAGSCMGREIRCAQDYRIPRFWVQFAVGSCIFCLILKSDQIVFYYHSCMILWYDFLNWRLKKKKKWTTEIERRTITFRGHETTSSALRTSLWSYLDLQDAVHLRLAFSFAIIDANISHAGREILTKICISRWSTLLPRNSQASLTKTLPIKRFSCRVFTVNRLAR